MGTHASSFSFEINFQVRDLQKKMQHVENDLDNTIEKLSSTNTKLDEKDKAFQLAEGEIQVSVFKIKKIHLIQCMYESVILKRIWKFSGIHIFSYVPSSSRIKG